MDIECEAQAGDRRRCGAAPRRGRRRVRRGQARRLRKQERQAVINDAAKRLGIEPAKLSDALKRALQDRVDAAVADGRLTKAAGRSAQGADRSGRRAALLRRRGPPSAARASAGRLRPSRRPGKLDAAAKYLGITEAQLRTELAERQDARDVAKAHGKTVDGLVNALVDGRADEARRSGQGRQADPGAGGRDAQGAEGSTSPTSSTARSRRRRSATITGIARLPRRTARVRSDRRRRALNRPFPIFLDSLKRRVKLFGQSQTLLGRAPSGPVRPSPP